MMKGKHVPVNIIIVPCLIFLVGCSSQEPEAQQSTESPVTAVSNIDKQDLTLVDSTDSMAEKDCAGGLLQEDSQNNRENVGGEVSHVPALPDTGSRLTDFVPQGWALWDSVELDFNEDGIPDYVGVLDRARPDTEDGTRWDSMLPRILFAIASDGTDHYCLDFQDINLIRTREEGGVYGDPYEPLTAEGTSFTTHAYGGSAWKWSEADTYTYDAGVWYKTMSESTYGYGPLVTSYQKDDWEGGIGIRKKRSDDFEDMEKYWDSEESWAEDVFDVEYEVSLDAPPTLYQAGMRWWLAPDRVTDWAADSIEVAEDIRLSQDRVKRPDEAYLADYCDEDCVLYTFQDGDSSLYYLAMYRFQDRSLAVLAESDTAIANAAVYKGKVYYSTGSVKAAAYKQMEDQEGQIVEEEGTVGICLNRMDPDGSGKEVIFEYEYPEVGREVLESRLPDLALSYEISGDEIIAEVYVGNEPRLLYRMGSDGSRLRRIGQIPAGS